MRVMRGHDGREALPSESELATVSDVREFEKDSAGLYKFYAQLKFYTCLHIFSADHLADLFNHSS